MAYTYRNGTRYEKPEPKAPEYIIKHEFEMYITPKGKLSWRLANIMPNVGVKVTTRYNIEYVVGPNGNLVRVR